MKPCGWNRGIAPHILEFSTRWRRVVSFTPQLPYLWERFITTYVCILLDGAFIHLLCIIMFKEQEKRNIPETDSVRTGVLRFVYSYKCILEGLPT
jgi:hypothetical protein